MSEQPRDFEDVITIVWPAPSGTAALNGWRVQIIRKGKPIPTVTALTVHSDADSTVWAELTMFAGEDGRPVYDGDQLHVREGEIITGTFPFLVYEMRVAS